MECISKFETQLVVGEENQFLLNITSKLEYSRVEEVCCDLLKNSSLSSDEPNIRQGSNSKFRKPSPELAMINTILQFLCFLLKFPSNIVNSAFCIELRTSV